MAVLSLEPGFSLMPRYLPGALWSVLVMRWTEGQGSEVRNTLPASQNVMHSRLDKPKALDPATYTA